MERIRCGPVCALVRNMEDVEEACQELAEAVPGTSTKRSINPRRLGAADTSKRTWERCPNAAPDRCP